MPQLDRRRADEFALWRGLTLSPPVHPPKKWPAWPPESSSSTAEDLMIDGTRMQPKGGS